MTPSQLLTFRGNGNVRVDLDRLIESRFLVQTNSGGGKSWAIRYMCEQTHGRVQQIIIDREGEFATLREKYDYLLVGREGDVAADIRSAKLLARKLLELGLSAVVDLSEMSLSQQRDYVRVFIEAINHLPRAFWKDCLIIIDEAHLFAPESGKGSSAALEAISMLLSTGRKRGFCGVLATQRLAKLNKDVSAECLNKLIGRTSEEDLKRAADELALNKDSAKALRSLEPGTFWAYGPAIAAEPVFVHTGTVATHPPKRGASREAAPATPDAVKKVLAELADLPKKAADEEHTLDELNREVASLRRQLTIAQKSGVERVVEKKVVDHAATQAAVDKAVNAALWAERKKIVTDLRHVHSGLSKYLTPFLSFPSAIGKLAELANSIADRNATQPVASAAARTQTRTTTGDQRVASTGGGITRRPAPEPRQSSSNGDLGKGEKIVLAAIAQYPEGAARDQLSVLTGYKRSSRDTYIQRLASAGYVEADGSLIVATDAGIDALGSDYTPLPTGDELLEFWFARLPEGERKILDALCEAYPDAVGRNQLDDVTGYKRSSRDTYIQRLRSRRLVEDAGRGEVRASGTLFSDV